MRFLVMRRDYFKCRLCGVSPAMKPGTVLVVDHVKAWETGGESVMDNLQTLCEPYNGGKSNLPLNGD
jgi:5-methylcytosine-specific restriction endonuclease McrA